MDRQEAITESLKLVERSAVCMVGTITEDGFPNIKSMFNLKHDGFKRFWFSTNTSSRRVKQLQNDKRGCVYFLDEILGQGLMLVGTIEILQDIESKKLLWTEKSEKYYSFGTEDPDYAVLCFTAAQGNYYHELSNVDFEIK